MRAKLTILLMAILPLAAPLFGQSPAVSPVPRIILSGLDAYRSGGPGEAIRAWLKGSPIEGSKDALAQASQLQEVQVYYGSYRSFDLISTKEISPTTHLVYMVLNFDKGPLFAKFLLYRTRQGWVVASFVFNTNPDAVLPSSLP